MIVKENCISTLDFLSIIIAMQFATKVYDLNNLSIFLIMFLKLYIFSFLNLPVATHGHTPSHVTISV
jgi:hypothetical protein